MPECSLTRMANGAPRRTGYLEHVDELPKCKEDRLRERRIGLDRVDENVDRRRASHSKRQLPQPLGRLRTDSDGANKHALRGICGDANEAVTLRPLVRRQARRGLESHRAETRSSPSFVRPWRPRVGEDPGRDHAVVRLHSRPHMSAAATRAWYFPTCVKSAMPLHVSNRSDILGGTQALVDLDPTRRRTTRRVARARAPRRSAAGPVATAGAPLRRWRQPTASMIPGSTASTATPVKTSMPSSRKTSPTIAPASSCTRPSKRGPRSITVTRSPGARRTARARRRPGRRP